MDGLASSAKPPRSFGELLRQHRLAAGIAQETLAERARLSAETISALERGARQKPYLETIALLAEALGLSPEGRAELERAASRRSVQPQLPTNNLPVQISSFVGREDDVLKVGEILAAYRLLTLVGPGGVGKTRLALRVAAALVGARRDGVWFVDFGALSDASQIASAIATGVGVNQSSDLDQLSRFFQTKTVLLIFDNCEHLVEGVALAIDTILRACPAVAILATSREPLSIVGERVYRVPPLELNDAIKLFAERAEAADSRFQLTASVQQSVAKICGLLDGIALAIEIVAARTAVVSLEDIAAELEHHLHSIVGGSRARAPRQRTMNALFNWSYQLLDEREKLMFRWVSVFVGGFSRELAVGICSAPEIAEVTAAETLVSLTSKSLVQGDAQSEPPRYRLLEPARQYAREKLRLNGEERTVARAHALAMLALAERFDSPQELTPDRVREAVVDPERENFRVAIEWALGKNGDTTIAQRLIGSRTAMWYGLLSGAAQGWIELALASCDATTPRHVRANLELAAARLATEFVPDPEAAVDRAERALRTQAPDDPGGVAGGQYLLGVALANCGRTHESEAAFRKALATARSAGLQHIVAAATVSLGSTRSLLGDLDEARDLLRKALQVYRSTGCERNAASTAASLAEVELAAGELEAASRLSRDVADFFFSSGRERLPATTAGQLAEIEFWVGHTEAALELSQHAADLFGAQHDWGLQALVVINRAAYLVALRRFDEARSEARDGLLLAHRIGMRRIVPWALQHLAAVAGLRVPADGDRLNILRSAQLLGFVDEAYARAAGVRQRTEQQEREKLLFLLRERVGEQELAKFMAEGATWTEERAITEALEI